MQEQKFSALKKTIYINSYFFLSTESYEDLCFEQVDYNKYINDNIIKYY